MIYRNWRLIHQVRRLAHCYLP
ncbi:hypothetical protein RSAG8_13726, partial [Rhizoctonia solani AG-8 WAC10335]